MVFLIEKGCIKGSTETNLSDKLHTVSNLKEDI